MTFLARVAQENCLEFRRVARLIAIMGCSGWLWAGSTPGTVTLTTSANPATFGSVLTLTVAISPATATGRVVFYDNAATVLGAATLSQGQASIATRFTIPGAHRLTARYLGNSIFSPGISTPVAEQLISSPQTGFATRTDYATGSGPVFAAQGDLNNDSYPDLVVVNAATGSLSILIGSSAGTYTPAAGPSLAANTNPSSVAIGDFNGDGLPDLAIANQATNNVSIFFGNGRGGFTAEPNVDAGAGPASIAASDFNGDGAIDLVVADAIDGGVSILIGNGDGTFQPAVFVGTGGDPRCVAVADFNGDGKPDIAVANANITGSGSISLLPGNGDGAFGTAVTYSAGANPQFLIAADLNNDGLPDLAAASQTDGLVSVLLANADGTLKPPVNYSIAGANGIAAGDFNGDGKADLAVTGSGNQVTILAGYGNGSFHTAGSSTVNSGPVFLVAGDFNGDGRTDVATVNNAAGDVSVLPGAAPGSVTAVSSSLNPSAYGQAVSFTATVSPAGAGGRITLYDGVSVVGSAPLAGSEAVVATAALSAGPHNITAFYSGDATHPPSTSRALSQTVNALPANGFQPPLQFAAGSNPRVIAAADFNGDGLVDIAVANDFSSGNNTINILLGTGNGYFGAPASYTVGTKPSSIAIGDFNQDGKLDLAVANEQSAFVSILFGNGDGTFQQAVNVNPGQYPAAIAVADFNGDGVADMAITLFSNTGQDNLTVMLGDGHGGFHAVSNNYAIGIAAVSIAATDFNNDGIADLAVASYSGITILLGNGDGTFQSPVNYRAGNVTASVAVGDFNGDGNIDIAAADFANNKVDVLLGIGDGTFEPAVAYGVSGALSVAVGDANGDGKPDLFVAGASAVDVLLGNGDGTFQPAVSYPAGITPYSIAVADFNNDGRSDFAVANDSDVSVTLGNPASSNTVTVTSSPNPSSYGQTVAVTASVSPPGQGMVTFYDGAAVLGSTALNGSAATLSTNALASGPHALKAYFRGTGFGQVGTSGIAIQTVKSNLQTGFTAPVFYSATSAVSFIVAADFNGDGKPDLATAGAPGTYLNVLLNNGNGTFGAPVIYASGGNTASIAVADFNGDGKPDLALAGDYGVSILAGKGDGTFQNAVTSSIGLAIFPVSMAAADFNNDGFVDLALVAPNGANGLVVLLLGKGNGSFQTPITFATASYPSFVSVGDFNGDGKPDIAVSNAAGTGVTNTNSVSVLLGNGNGTFQQAVAWPVGANPKALAVGDLNGDGKLDIVSANYDDNTVSVLLGKGDGTFQTSVSHPAGATPVFLLVSDVTGDGKPDLIVADANNSNVANGDEVTLQPGNGDGTFQTAVTYPVAHEGDALALADFNGDGTPDLVVGSSNASITLFPGNAPTGATATSTALTANPSPARYGQVVTLQARVSPAAAAGRIGFYDGANLLGSGTLAGGTATLETGYLGTGVHALHAVYAGSATYAGSASTALSETIDAVSEGDLGPAASIPLSDRPGKMVTGDFNNDGKPDLAVVLTSAVDVFLGNGDGTFQAPKTVGINARYIAIGDFNGDGNTDIAATTGSFLTTVTILLGNGDGTFTATGAGITDWTDISAIAIGDFNGDGNADIAIADGGLTIFLGNGDGTFGASFQYGANQSGAVAVADFNRDGKADVVIGSADGPVLFLGNGDGSFQAGTIWSAGSASDLLVTGDFNADGNPDIAVAVSTPPGSGALAFLAGRGDGTFAPPASIPTGLGAASIIAGDFNGDGIQDVVIGLEYPGGAEPIPLLSVWFGGASGFSAAAHTYMAGISPVSLAAADFNGDGRTDIAASDNLDESLTVLLGRAPAQLTLTTSSNQSTYGQSVILTAAVAPPSASGFITFYDGVQVLGTSAVVNGTATFSTPFLPLGTAGLKATYTGNAGDSTVTSPSVTQTVTTVPQNSLAAGTSLTTATPQALATADFNGDGVPDLAVANYGSGNVSIFAGAGGGAFAAPTVYAVGGNPNSMATGDFNLDGKLDLLVSTGNAVLIMQGNGDGTFGTPQILTTFTSNASVSVIVADFNQDGKPDVAYETLGGAVEILLGNGDGTFSATPGYAAGYFASAMAAGDLNGDGRVDLVVANSTENTISVLIGNGDGSFQNAVTYPADNFTSSVTIGDFNGDGKPDLAAANIYSNDVSILLGKGDGTFAAAQNYPAGQHAGAVLSGDFNGDGVADLAVADELNNGISLLMGKGDGSFQPPLAIATGNYPVALASGEFNGDGRVDLAVANYYGNSVSILLAREASGPDLTIQSGHTGSFSTGTSQFAYTLTVANAGSAPSTGVVTVTDSLPAALAAAAMSGTGWTCNGAALQCTRQDSLAPLASYPPITLTVTVTTTAAASVTNSATVSGVGDSYAANDVSYDITAVTAPQAQTIVFGALASVTLPAQPFSLHATASSGLTVSFSSSTPTVCTVSGTTVTAVAAGTCTVLATQTGNTSWASAAPVMQSFVVNAAAPSGGGSTGGNTGGSSGGGGVAAPISTSSLTANPVALTFNVPVNSSPVTQTITLTYQSSSLTSPSYYASGGATQAPSGWLGISSNTGNLTIDSSGSGPLTYSASVTITVNPAGLSAGAYSGMWTFNVSGNIATLPVTVNVVSSQTFALPHFAAGGTYTTVICALNSASQPAKFSAAIRGDDGSPVALNIAGIGSVNSFSTTVPALGMQCFSAANPQGPTIGGSILVTADPGITVQALFRNAAADGHYYEASIPASTGGPEWITPFDATTFAATGSPIFIGIALANLDSGNAANVACTARDSNGNVIAGAVSIPTLNPGGHWASYQFPALAGLRGTIDCASNTSIAMLALRYLGSSAFSSLPVVAPGAGLGFVIPHFAAGGTYVTGFFVMNTAAAAANFSIAFRDSSGAPVSLAISGGASGSTLSDTVPAHGLRYYEASSTSGQTLSGSGVITADPGIAIQALFRNHAADNNYYEASVPTSSGATEFEIPFDGTTFAPTASPTYTGLAIANDTSASVTVSCTARDQSGSVIANAITVPALAPAGHWADYQFPALAGNQGTIDCRATAPVSAMGLRYLGDFAFSSLPVVTK